MSLYVSTHQFLPSVKLKGLGFIHCSNNQEVPSQITEPIMEDA